MKNGEWSEVKRSEVKWTDLKRDDKTPESGRKWKMANEVKWNEVKWNEVKLSERIWSVVIKRLKVAGSEKWEVKCSEVNWTDLKRLKVAGSEKWGVKWSEAKIFGEMYVLSWTYSYAVCIWVTVQYVAHLREQRHNSKCVIFQEKCLKVL